MRSVAAARLPVNYLDALVATWVISSALLVLSGWALSAIGEVNRIGYGVVVIVVGFVVAAVARQYGAGSNGRLRLRRFRRTLPALFVGVAVIAFIGGAFHAPANYDALTYRLPRVLHWVAAGHWIWIVTLNPRMNFSATGFEWMSAPWVVLTRSDRLLFLLNFIPFLLLPGLIFSVFRQFGVSWRAAWVWMWVLPCAYCYALQANSIANDAVAAVFVLAAIHAALRAARVQTPEYLWLAILAAALVTGIKASNLPLLLPCLIALWPARKTALKRPLITAAVLMVAALVSFGPVALLNHRHTGDWTGDPQNRESLQLKNPLAAFAGNMLQLVPQTLQPPVWPGARSLAIRLPQALPALEALKRDFPRFELQFDELPNEGSGLGAGITLLLGCSLIYAVVSRRRYRPTLTFVGAMVSAGAVIALIVYVTHMGSESTARLLAPYYPLLIVPLLAHRSNSDLVGQPWFRGIAAVSVLTTGLALILTPAAPLWPAQTVLARLQSRWPQNAELLRARNVYAAYAERNDILGPLRAWLPPDDCHIGIVADEDDSELALWRPFGERTVTDLVGNRSWEEESRPFSWIVGKTAVIRDRFGASPTELLARSAGQLIASRSITSKVSVGPEEWIVARMPAASAPRSDAKCLSPAGGH